MASFYIIMESAKAWHPRSGAKDEADDIDTFRITGASCRTTRNKHRLRSNAE